MYCASRRAAVLLLAAVPLAAGAGARSGPGQATDPDLETGVRQAQEGDYGRAVVTLDGVARRLRERGATAEELSRAHVYLAVAHLGLGQEQAARSSLLEALRVEPGLLLSPDEYPARVVRFFEEVRRSQGPAAPSAKASGAAGAPAPKGRSKAPLVLVGVAGAAAAGAAVALGGGGGGGGGSNSSSPTPAQTPPTPVAVTGTLTLLELSPPAGSTIRVSGRSIAAGSGLLEMRFGVLTSADVSGGSLYVGLRKENGVYAAYGRVNGLTLRAGESKAVVANAFTLQYDPPFETTHMEVVLSGPSTEPIVTAYFNSVGYSFTGP